MRELTCDDVLEYQNLLKMAPLFILKRMARKKSNLVKKFEPKVKSYVDNLDSNHQEKLNILLNSNIDDLQALMDEAYKKSNNKQFKILADPKNKEFIHINLEELKKLVNF
jgi:vacuolar-type H+-ATPase subunit E/Vma4